MAYVNLGMPTMFNRAVRAVNLSADGVDAGIDAVIFSAIAVESFPSDFATWASYEAKNGKDVSPKLTAAVEILEQAESDRVQVKLKYQLLYYALTGNAAITGSQPFQDFSFLIELRNALVHHKPDIVVEHGKFSRDIKAIHAGLIQRKLVKRDAQHMPYDWRALLDEDPRVSLWAVNTSASLVKWVVDAMPTSQAKDAYLNSGIYKWKAPKK